MSLDPHEVLLYSRAQARLEALPPAQLQAWLRRLSRMYQLRLRRFLPPTGARILDVPCGHGNLLQFLADRGYSDVTGVDLAETQVRLAASLGLPARVGDAFAAVDDAHGWDAVFSLDFIEHLDRDAAVRFLALVRSRLRAGGRLFLRLPSADGPFGAHDVFNDVTHKWTLTAGAAETLLAAIGFSRVHVLDERPLPTGVVGAARWAVFHVARVFSCAWCIAMGLRPPRVWSRSMWVVAEA